MERRHRKGRGVNPGTGVKPGDHVENNPILSIPKAAERRQHKGRGVNPGNGFEPRNGASPIHPIASEPRSGDIIETEV